MHVNPQNTFTQFDPRTKHCREVSIADTIRLNIQLDSLRAAHAIIRSQLEDAHVSRLIVPSGSGKYNCKHVGRHTVHLFAC